MKYIVEKEALSPQLLELITLLSEDYPISFEGDGILISFEQVKSNDCTFSCEIASDKINITYSTITSAARAIASALSNISCSESSSFKSLGIMLDVSRGMVMKVDHLKKWFRKLALSGFNTVMLYCEDTYLLEDEPFFSRFRGGYSASEIKELDFYAQKLGIELVGCIQTLGHMEQALRWKTAYKNVSDTSFELLVGEEKTYQLIEKMLAFWSQNLATRRIHIGMDEAVNLGRGKYLDLHGYQNPFDIFNNHLSKVNEICQRFNLEPLIWSDMYFRFGNSDHEYYQWEKPLDKEVMDKVPKNVSLVYWDYYHTGQDVYEKMIQRHREQGFEPIVASGLWTWPTLWYNHEHSIQTVPPCIKACQETKVKELIFTMWGDDGAYCNWDSALYGIIKAAELSFNAQEDYFEKRFSVICQANYTAATSAAQFGYLLFNVALMIWDDPLMGIFFDEMVTRDGEKFVPTAIKKCDEIIDSISGYLDETAAGDMEHLNNILQLVKKKIEFRYEFKQAYAQKDYSTLTRIANDTIPELISLVKAFNSSFRRQYVNCAKVYGLDRIQLRNGGLIARLEECSTQIMEFVNKKVDHIPELEQLDTQGIRTVSNSYASISTGSVNRW